MRAFIILFAVVALTSCDEEKPYDSKRCKTARAQVNMALTMLEQLDSFRTITGIKDNPIVVGSDTAKNAEIRDFISEHSECFKSGL